MVQVSPLQRQQCVIWEVTLTFHKFLSVEEKVFTLLRSLRKLFYYKYILSIWALSWNLCSLFVRLVHVLLLYYSLQLMQQCIMRLNVLHNCFSYITIKYLMLDVTWKCNGNANTFLQFIIEQFVQHSELIIRLISNTKTI